MYVAWSICISLLEPPKMYRIYPDLGIAFFSKIGTPALGSRLTFHGRRFQEKGKGARSPGGIQVDSPPRRWAICGNTDGTRSSPLSRLFMALTPDTLSGELSESDWPAKRITERHHGMTVEQEFGDAPGTNWFSVTAK